MNKKKKKNKKTPKSIRLRSSIPLSTLRIAKPLERRFTIKPQWFNRRNSPLPRDDELEISRIGKYSWFGWYERRWRRHFARNWTKFHEFHEPVCRLGGSASQRLHTIRFVQMDVSLAIVYSRLITWKDPLREKIARYVRPSGSRYPLGTFDLTLWHKTDWV